MWWGIGPPPGTAPWHPPWQLPLLLAALLPLLLLLMALPRTAQAEPFKNLDWQRRAVYQLVTDRFASPLLMPNVVGKECRALNNYCGGTWQGMLDQLRYIQGLNLNAIWSSPITVQSYGGYHGYWPTNLYDVNPAFGSAQDLNRVLNGLAEQGMYSILDLVMNHVGYGSSIFLPGFNPFSSQTDFHNCTLAGCDENCNIPENPTFEQIWHCRLSALPDLNQSLPHVRDTFANWIKWTLSQFSAVNMLRLDAAGSIDPDFFPFFMNQTKLPAILEIGGPLSIYPEYEKVRGNASWSYQSWAIHGGCAACFGLQPTELQDDVGCQQISTSRTYLRRIGIDMSLVGYWCENHDTDRFLTTRDSLPAYRNALAYIILAEGIPLIYYGAEQALNGSLSNLTNRPPLWEVGFGTHSEMYKYIRTLGWYRWWMKLGSETFTEHYVDRRTYSFSRGKQMLVVLTNGNYSADVPRPSVYNMTGLSDLANVELCDALRSGYCVEVLADGTASVEPSPGDEPLLLVHSSWVKEADFFTVLDSRPVLWEQGLIVTFSTLAGAVLLWLAAVYGLQYWHTRTCTLLADTSAACCSLVAACRRCKMPSSAHSIGADESPLNQMNGVDSSVSSDKSKVTDADSKDLAAREGALMTAMSMLFDYGEISKSQSLMSTATSHGSLVPSSTAMSSISQQDALLPTRLSTHTALRLDSLVSHKPCSMLHALVDCLKADRRMVMHVALEYSVPHLGLTNQLMYGGLGKVMETFITHATRPMLVCAPMYAPYYTHEADGKPQLLPPFLDASPVLSAPVVVGGSEHLVDVYVTAAPTTTHAAAAEDVGRGGTMSDRSPFNNDLGKEDEESPTVFYLLLASPMFSQRTCGIIYQHASEVEELAFFSIFNQAVAAVVETLGVASLQFHDCHGALSVMYLTKSIPVRTLLVAHNADYNGTWHLGTPEREAWVYAQLNIPLNNLTRRLCEHDGRFNMLRPVLEHMRTRQMGMGVVAVSPRYAIRAREKFSIFWQLPSGAVGGILNGIEDTERPAVTANAAADIDDFFAKKKAAKLAFQKAKGLQVGEDRQLLVFMGRITHQKGCDIIAMAAKDILVGSPLAQIGMVGPIGDEYGEQAKHMLERVSQEFPGRVWNGAGLYAMGAEKEQLGMAADFFLCPSRFEPCGLADIEFGWLGVVMIGHNTGGLGKMPGFYYVSELDCNEEHSIRFTHTALKALAAPAEEIRCALGWFSSPLVRRVSTSLAALLTTPAIKADFPPARMVRQYDRQWRILHGRSVKPSHGSAMAPEEEQFYANQWLENNTPYNPKNSEERQKQKARRELHTWLHNLLLILMEAVLQVPSVLSLLWYSDTIKAGSIQFEHSSTWGGILDSPVAIFFYIYAGSALMFQVLGFMLPPYRFMQMGASINMLAVLLFMWALYIPQMAKIVYITNSVTAACWGPMASFIFLDLSRASVSQHGPAVMGYADVLDRTMSVAAVWALMSSQGSTNIGSYQVASILLLVIAVWLALWLLRRHSLSPHFEHYRLRLRGQLSLMLRHRRTWLFAVTVTTIDTFAVGFLVSLVFDLAQNNVQWFSLSFALVNLVSIGAVGFFLTIKPGRRLGLRLMWAIAIMPCVTVMQAVLVQYGGTAGIYIASTVLGAAHVRTNLVGLLNLHTLPSREIFTMIRTMQVIFGSLALVLGLTAGAKQDDTSGEVWMLMGTYEGVRLVLVLVMMLVHRRENIAKP